MAGDISKTTSTEFDQILVDHAVRCWDAERENANRLSSRATLLLSALAALFGLGLFRIDWFRGEHDVSRVQSILAIYGIKILIGLALLLFGFSFWRIMGRRGKRNAEEKPHSADFLSLPRSIISGGPLAPDDARKIVFIRVYRAYQDLQARNAMRKAALDGAQGWFLFGLALIGFAILVYIFTGEPPKM